MISLCDQATAGLWPDLTVLLEIDPEVSLGRASGDDRFEAEGLDLQRAVAVAYDEIARVASDRIVAIDAEGSVEEIHRQVMEAVDAHRAA